MANATIAFVEAVRLNRQLSSKVSGIMAKFLRTWLDDDKIFKEYE